MQRDEILTWVTDERLGLADFLDGLDDHEWEADSLCPGWRVHDVAAHLTLSTRTTLLVAIKGEPTIAALDHVRDSTFYGARERFRGMRLVATDCEWSAGEGSYEVRGPAGDLLLVATGRVTGLAALTGTGLEQVATAV